MAYIHGTGSRTENSVPGRPLAAGGGRSTEQIKQRHLVTLTGEQLARYLHVAGQLTPEAQCVFFSRLADGVARGRKPDRAAKSALSFINKSAGSGGGGCGVSKKARGGICTGCGKGLKKKAEVCPSCHRPTDRSGNTVAGKVYASAGVLYKTVGSNVVPIGSAVRSGIRKSSPQPSCWNGCPPGARGARFCGGCGEQYGIGYAGHVDRAVKSAWMPPVPGYGDWHDEPDSHRAAQLRDMQVAQLRERGGEVAWLAKASGGLRSAWEQERDPERADVLWRAMHPGTYPSGGNIA